MSVRDLLAKNKPRIQGRAASLRPAATQNVHQKPDELNEPESSLQIWRIQRGSADKNQSMLHQPASHWFVRKELIYWGNELLQNDDDKQHRTSTPTHCHVQVALMSRNQERWTVLTSLLNKIYLYFTINIRFLCKPVVDELWWFILSV